MFRVSPNYIAALSVLTALLFLHHRCSLRKTLPGGWLRVEGLSFFCDCRHRSLCPWKKLGLPIDSTHRGNALQYCDEPSSHCHNGSGDDRPQRVDSAPDVHWNSFLPGGSAPDPHERGCGEEASGHGEKGTGPILSSPEESSTGRDDDLLGSSAIFIKLGVECGGSPVMGSLIAYTSASIVISPSAF